jgi:hypothetical protein
MNELARSFRANKSIDTDVLSASFSGIMGVLPQDLFDSNAVVRTNIFAASHSLYPA